MTVGPEAATVLGSALGAALALGIPLWFILRRVRPWVHMMDDLVGEDARPGKARHPGLMERMQHNEHMVAVAAEQASAAKDSAWRNEDLMKRHMENGLAIMQVGLHNDTQLYEALRENGIEVTDLLDYPAIDIGDDPPKNRRITDG